MKIKCPGCSKVLNIPEGAAGKVVKCPSCAKQIRVPGGAGGQQKSPTQRPAPQATVQPAPVQPAPVQPSPVQQTPVQQVPQQPAAQAWVPPGSELPPPPSDNLFDELTEQDLSGVRAVQRPGAQKSAGPAAPSGLHAVAGVEEDSGSAGGGAASVLGVLAGVAAIAGGIGIIVWYFGFAEESEDSGFRLRRRSPIGLGIALIIAGFGWIGNALGMYGGGDD